MSTRETVRHAWQLTQAHLRRLIWYAGLPSFFVMVVSSAYLAYQYNAFRHSTLFSEEVYSVLDSVKDVWGVVSNYPTLAIFGLLLAVIFLAGYFISPPMFRGMLIHALDKIRQNQSLKGSVEVGMRRFFPMFEYGLLTGIFGITTLFAESSLILRWWGVKPFLMALPFLLFIAIVGFVVSFLFTYAEYYIILEDKKVIQAIMDSITLVLSNLRQTFLVLILMILIGARIIVNAILVLLIPMGIIALASLFPSFFLTPLGLTLMAIFAFVILIVSAYLLGLFSIFATAVWVLTFGELRKESGPAPMSLGDNGQTEESERKELVLESESLKMPSRDENIKTL